MIYVSFRVEQGKNGDSTLLLFLISRTPIVFCSNIVVRLAACKRRSAQEEFDLIYNVFPSSILLPVTTKTVFRHPEPSHQYFALRVNLLRL
jgi:hypothetical protein